MKIIERKAKSIFTRTTIPGIDYTLNQYVGCGHKCAYCYARYINKWKEYGKWGTWIEVKTNAPELTKSKIKGSVSMSSVSDPYQPIEKELKLTRRILENLDKNTTLSILTKSDLILRDIDILKKFKALLVGLTVNCFPDNVREILEPYAPSNEKRIQTLKELKESGIKTYCFISPVIPDLTRLREVLTKTENIVNYYIIELLNTNLAGSKFKKMIREKFPGSYEYLINRRKMDNFIKQIREYLNKNNIPVSGFIIHEGSNLY